MMSGVAEDAAVYRTFKYRLWTTPDQERELGTMLESHRRLYNEVLSLKQMAWQTAGVTVTRFDFINWFTRQRRTNPFWMRLNVCSAGLTIQRVDRAFESFFRRVKAGQKPGYPRFKTQEHFSSVTFSSDARGWSNGCKLIDSRLRIQHVGTIRVKLHRPVEGKIKTTTLKREGGKWYVAFCCDLGDVKVPPSDKPAVGIDVGLESFLTTSEGVSVNSRHHLADALPELRRLRRRMSRREEKGGSNWRKAAKRCARAHAKVTHLRRQFHHTVACHLIRCHGLIAVERLNVIGLLRSGRNSRAIGDAGWSGFIGILKCKAERAGVQVVEVDCRGTSQECSGCGRVVEKALSVRRHDCPHCGLSIGRDHNAALNILARARQDRAGPAGANVAAWGQAFPEKPLETAV